MNQRSENPFYGQKELLSLWQQGSAKQITKQSLINLLNAAWAVSKDSHELRKLFFIIVMSYGEITNRHHNILKGIKKLDNGGSAWREGFIWSMEWMRKNTTKQYYIFLTKDILRQFVGLMSILINRIKTIKGKTTIVETYDSILEHNIPKLAKYLATIITSSNPAEKNLIAKAITRPRFSKRQKTNRTGEKLGTRDLKPETLKNMKSRELLIKTISDILGWKYTEHHGNIYFDDFYKWKKEYGAELESVLFSSGKIVEFDHDQFFKWLDIQPSGARRRVRRRLLTKDSELIGKWKSNYGNIDFGLWFLEWEAYKEAAQQEQRELTEKVRNGNATEDEVIKLEKVKKQARVTTGGSDIKEELEKVLTKKISIKESDLIAQSLMDKMDLQIPVAVICDISGSMGYNTVTTKNGTFRAIDAANILTTLLMLKNPSKDLDQFLVTFNNSAKFHFGISNGEKRVNHFMTAKEVKVDVVNRTQSFSKNFNNISALTYPTGGTNIRSIATAFKTWIDAGNTEMEKLNRKETIQQYPVLFIVSDGDMNNSGTPVSSFLEFQQSMKQWCGWEGVTVIFDVCTSNDQRSTKFDNVENIIHFYGWNIGNINTIFSKLHDMDIIDIYTPLNSLFQNNRYDIIKTNTI